MSGSTLIFATIAGVLPSLIWLWFWLREDDLNPEPRGLLATVFLGGMIAVIVSIFGEQYVANQVADSSMRYILWSAVEEICKFVAVFAIALNTDYNDEPIDAMMYCVVAALGFAALENVFFLFGPLSGGAIAESIITGNMRFVGATLVHIVSSAMVGFSLGLAFYRGYVSKMFAVILGLSLATALHAAFNISIINVETVSTLVTFGWVWGSVVILLILFEEIKAVPLRSL